VRVVTKIERKEKHQLKGRHKKGEVRGGGITKTFGGNHEKAIKQMGKNRGKKSNRRTIGKTQVV